MSSSNIAFMFSKLLFFNRDIHIKRDIQNSAFQFKTNAEMEVLKNKNICIEMKNMMNTKIVQRWKNINNETFCIERKLCIC